MNNSVHSLFTIQTTHQPLLSNTPLHATLVHTLFSVLSSFPALFCYRFLASYPSHYVLTPLYLENPCHHRTFPAGVNTLYLVAAKPSPSQYYHRYHPFPGLLPLSSPYYHRCTSSIHVTKRFLQRPLPGVHITFPPTWLLFTLIPPPRCLPACCEACVTCCGRLSTPREGRSTNITTKRQGNKELISTSVCFGLTLGLDLGLRALWLEYQDVIY